MQNLTTLKKLHEHTFSIRGALKFLTILSVGLALNSIAQNSAYASGVVGNGTSASCTEAALTTALTGGGNVSFNCGTSAVTITLSSEKVISATTVVDGGNKIILSGGKKTRIFKTAGNGIEVTIKNLTITDGYSTDDGGGIYNGYNNKLSVINCQFNNNVSTKAAVSGDEHGGGAIYSYPSATLIVDNSTFTGNKASLGGAIMNLNSDLTVTNSTFTSNSAVDTKIGNGGAIYVDGAIGGTGKISLSNSTFSKNTATSYGGAFFNSIYNNTQTIIEKCTFSDNSVGGGSNGQGGAIWSTGDPSGQNAVNKTTLTVNNTTVSGNTASQQGGGIWLGRHPEGIKITNTTVSGNTTTNSNGGGILLGDNGKLNITNSTISGNKVLGSYALGGGIVVANGQASITNTTIAGNYSYFQAGGIANINDNAPVTLTNTIVANNEANNGGNNATWGKITQNCFKKAMTNGGNNLQFPAPNGGDIGCTSGLITNDPKLGSLANNGGPTQTMALLSGSAAINAASDNVCPTTDQRGVARPQGAKCDIGAYEAN